MQRRFRLDEDEYDTAVQLQVGDVVTVEGVLTKMRAMGLDFDKGRLLQVGSREGKDTDGADK